MQTYQLFSVLNVIERFETFQRYQCQIYIPVVKSSEREEGERSREPPGDPPSLLHQDKQERTQR